MPNAPRPQNPDPKIADARRPYEPPRILSSESLETLAAICAPSPPAKSNPGLCPTGPVSS